MKRIVLLILTLFAMSMAAHASPSRTVVPPESIALHVSGGIVGLDDWIIVKPDGTVIVATRQGERVARKLTAADRAALAAAFDAQGFFGWYPVYGGPTAADGQTRTLSFDDGKRKKSVSWTDPGNPPAGFQILMKRMQALSGR